MPASNCRAACGSLLPTACAGGQFPAILEWPPLHRPARRGGRDRSNHHSGRPWPRHRPPVAAPPGPLRSAPGAVSLWNGLHRIKVDAPDPGAYGQPCPQIARFPQDAHYTHRGSAQAPLVTLPAGAFRKERSSVWVGLSAGTRCPVPGLGSMASEGRADFLALSQ